MKNINSIAVEGNLTKAPHVTEKGAFFTVAHNSYFKKKEDTDWSTKVAYIKCVIWGSNNIPADLQKGSSISLEGSIASLPNKTTGYQEMIVNVNKTTVAAPKPQPQEEQEAPQEEAPAPVAKKKAGRPKKTK